MSKIFTIGFAQKRAERFFSLLGRSDLRRLMDIRLNNNSQLSGFARGSDLPFFLGRLLGKEYIYEPRLAPSKEILSGYRDGEFDWPEYERRFLRLLDDRRVGERIDPGLLDGTCLLCSEPTPFQCHRRLVAEYFAGRRYGVEVIHL